MHFSCIDSHLDVSPASYGECVTYSNYLMLSYILIIEYFEVVPSVL